MGCVSAREPEPAGKCGAHFFPAEAAVQGHSDFKGLDRLFFLAQELIGLTHVVVGIGMGRVQLSGAPQGNERFLVAAQGHQNNTGIGLINGTVRLGANGCIDMGQRFLVGACPIVFDSLGMLSLMINGIALT